ncbi:lecithin:cholesterol acyltransferase family protein [Dishui Lake large algae virus 1]|nr:lecithin:cholesterol acyltransferase family protein [Dishui Lake large algae virus 1]
MKPIIIIPGISGSILVNKHKTHKELLGRKILDNRWINIKPYSFDSVMTWKKEIGLDVIENSNGKITGMLEKNNVIGVYDMGGTKGICDVLPDLLLFNEPQQQYFENNFKFRYFHHMVKELHKVGFHDHHNLFGIPYDFRLVLDPEYRNKLFHQFQHYIETAAQKNGEKCVIVTHSLGGIMFKWFLTSMVSQQWIDNHIHMFVCINAPFCGAPFALKALLAGEYYVPFLQHIFRDEIQYVGGIIMCLPNYYAFGMDEPLWLYEHGELTLRDYKNFIDQEKHISFRIWNDLYKPHLPTIFKKIKVPTHVIVTNGVDTPSVFKSKKLTDIPKYHRFEMGDSIVTEKSLMYYQKLFERDQLRDLILADSDHTAAISDKRVLDLLKKYSLT